MFEILARGSTRNEALIEASRGLMSIITDPAPFGSSEEREFRAPGSNAAAQAVNWLNEIVFFFDTERIVFVSFTIDAWTGIEIAGRARGGFLDYSRQEFRTGVKAITYQHFEIQSTPEGWEIRAVVAV